ncbi:hypothetical protein [Gulbenkiania mobilis]|uniref:hypothetical protein n=1 Tax=Gulbenkiania mobilis TaxID=397457 RepID=UPI0006BBA606|nr:hypothetical protein [Gulbenkiania mobilis]
MQFQLAYQPEEDRLMLRVDAEGHRRGFWLTRRLTSLLIPILRQRLESTIGPAVTDEARPWMMALKQVSTRERYAPTLEAPMPLAEAPILAVTVRHGHDEQGRHLLGFFDNHGRGEVYSLSDDLLHLLTQMIDDALPQTDWALEQAFPQHAMACWLEAEGTLQ